MGGGGQTRTLADVIMAKIEEKNAMAAGGDAGSAAGDAMAADLPPKVLEVYTSVGKLLSTYRSGKLPKAFKIVPRLANWEEVFTRRILTDGRRRQRRRRRGCSRPT